MAHEFMSPERTGLIVRKADLADVQGDQVCSVFKVSGSPAIKKKKTIRFCLIQHFPTYWPQKSLCTELSLGQCSTLYS